MPITPHTAANNDTKVYPAFTYARLRNAVVSASKTLELNATSDDLKYIAWLTRNLLELRVWVGYCVASESNAIEFFLDSIRDLIDLNHKNPNQSPQEKKGLALVSSFLPPGKAHHEFTWASEAAKKARLKKMFDLNNKTLSKFVHPTAMSVCAPIPLAGARKIVERFVILGRELAGESLKALDSSYMKGTYKKYQSSIEAVAQKNPELDFTLMT